MRSGSFSASILGRESNTDMRDINESTVPDVVAPTVCPFCESADISTTSKAVTVSSYWRCAKCGQIWNSGRLREQRPADIFRWRGRGRP